jgi:hypothetical protein
MLHDICAKDLRIDDDSIVSKWSQQGEISNGVRYFGPFTHVDVLTKTDVQLTPGARYNFGIHLDMYALIANESCQIKAGNETLSVHPPQGGCTKGWEPVPSKLDVSWFENFVGQTNCRRRVLVPNVLVPDDGLLQVEVTCSIDAGFWGFHDMFFRVVSCPGDVEQQLGATAVEQSGNANVEQSGNAVEGQSDNAEGQ